MKPCPCCDHTLTETEVSGVTVSGCHLCGGLWFRDHDLTELTRHDIQPLEELAHEFPDLRVRKTDAHERRCPNCGTSLFRFHFKHSPNIHLDGCRECRGIWLDHEDLLAIEQRLKDYRSRAAQKGKTTSPPPAPETAPRERSAQEAIRFVNKVSCPHCHELNRSTNEVCWHCGERMDTAPSVPEEAVPAAPSEASEQLAEARLCPACHEPLVNETRHGVELLSCISCSGIWLREEVYVDLVVNRRERIGGLDEGIHIGGPASLPKEARCPFCQAHLWPDELVVEVRQNSFNTGVVAYTCPSCSGLWFQAGQLRQLHDGIAEYERQVVAGR